MEPLQPRQIEALRRTPNIETFKIMLDMSDFVLDLATKGGHKNEMQQLTRVIYGTKRAI